MGSKSILRILAILRGMYGVMGPRYRRMCIPQNYNLGKATPTHRPCGNSREGPVGLRLLTQVIYL